MQNIPGPNTGYIDLLNLEIANKQNKDRKDQQTGESKAFFPLRPSSAGACSRKLGYELTEYRGFGKYHKEIFEPNVWKLLNLGHSVEYSVIRNLELLEECGYKIKYKQQALSLFKLEDTTDENGKIIPGEIIEGSCDGVIIHDDYKAIFDVKSVKDGFSAAFKTRYDDVMWRLSNSACLTKLSESAFYIHDLEGFLLEIGDDDYHKDNIYQLSLYGSSRFMKDRGIDHCVIYKHNKNDSREYELRFKPSDKIAIKVKEKFNTVNELVSKKRLHDIPRDYNLGSFKCAFCPFKEECWSNDAKKAYFNTYPEKDWPIDSDRLETHKSIEDAFKKYLAVEKIEKVKESEEGKIVNLLVNAGVKKIRLKDKSIWELKELKTPRPHIELRRSKL